MIGVAEFYAGKSIFVTGGTGFIGKVTKYLFINLIHIIFGIWEFLFQNYFNRTYHQINIFNFLQCISTIIVRYVKCLFIIHIIEFESLT